MFVNFQVFLFYIPPVLLLLPVPGQDKHIHDSEPEESDQEEDIHPIIVPLQDLVAFHAGKNKTGNG
jgi:hypothetical protein